MRQCGRQLAAGKHIVRKKGRMKGILMAGALILASVVIYNDNLGEGIVYALFLAYGLLVFVLREDSRISVAAALVLLVLTPAYLIRGLEDFANFLATLAYFFLVIGVAKQFVEYIAGQRKLQDDA